MRILLPGRDLWTSDARGLTPIFATILLIGVTLVFAGVLSITVSQLNVSTAAPSASLTLHKQPSSGAKTVYDISHGGGDPLLGDEILIIFEASLNGRESVVGEIVGLSTGPTINWDKGPTVTSVSVNSEPMGDFDPGEVWILDLRAGSYSVDITTLSIVHRPSNIVILLAPDIEGI